MEIHNIRGRTEEQVETVSIVSDINCPTQRKDTNENIYIRSSAHKVLQLFSTQELGI